jgi:hypothetical protein
MATTVIEPGVALPVQEVRRAGGFGVVPVRVSWSAVFAGTITTFGVWILLYSLGLALGLSTLGPDSSNQALKGSGIFTGIWGLVSPLVALFCGGIIAAFSASRASKGEGVVHGIVVWALTLVLGFIGLGMVISAAVSGAAVVGKAAMEGIGKAAFSLNADDALKPINEKLKQEGKPAVTAEQLKAATGDVIDEAVKNNGQLNKGELSAAIAKNTDLSEGDANELADRVKEQFDNAKTNVGQGALKAADTTGKVFWGVFIALLLGLISAVLGGLVGAIPRRRNVDLLTTAPPAVLR